MGCVCCWCANAVPAVSNTSWGICWNRVNIYEYCCCGLFPNGIWLLSCLCRVVKAGCRRLVAMRGLRKERRSGSVCVCVCVWGRERENGGETELHTVHIDPAFVMVMLQSLDPAPGLEIYSVKSIFVQSAETNCTYLCCCVLRWRLTRVPPEQYNFVSQDFIGRNSMSKLSWKCRHAHVIKSTLFFFSFLRFKLFPVARDPSLASHTQSQFVIFTTTAATSDYCHH